MREGMEASQGRLWRVESQHGALWSITGLAVSHKIQGAGIDTVELRKEDEAVPRLIRSLPRAKPDRSER